MILRMVIERNRVCASLAGKQQGFEAWRLVTEVVLAACPSDLLQGETRQTVLLEIIQELLMKVNTDLIFYGRDRHSNVSDWFSHMVVMRDGLCSLSLACTWPQLQISLLDCFTMLNKGKWITVKILKPTFDV